MSLNFLSIITSPLLSYFEATIGLSCMSYSPEAEFKKQKEKTPPSKKALCAKQHKKEKYGYRPRKNSFSLRVCLQKHREMSSPKPLGESSYSEGWIEEELVLASRPHSNTDLTQ